MANLDNTLESLVARGIVESINRKLNESLELQKKLVKRDSRTGEIKQIDLINDLGISPNTLEKWEANGLPRIQRGKLVFYLLSDLHRFNY